MISPTVRHVSQRERHRLKTAHHPHRNTLIRRLRSRGWSIRRLARRFMLSSTRAWEICDGEGAWFEPRATGPITLGKSLTLPGVPKGTGGTSATPPRKGARSSITSKRSDSNRSRSPGRGAWRP